jgi:hypothetical protein
MTFIQQSYAQGIKNSDFLELPPEEQKFFLSGAIDTLGHVAFQRNEAKGKCIFDWYFNKVDNSKQNGVIFASFKKYPEYTPSSILIALTEKQCGRYVRTN